MKILVLSEPDLRELARGHGLRQAMREALAALSRGAAKIPRHVLPMSEGALGFMAAESAEVMGYKAVAVTPGNSAVGLNPHQGLVVLLDRRTGQVQALLEGSALTALRTAAVSAAAADVLARPEASRLALIGAGLQVLEHARAFAQIRRLQQITLYNRTRVGAEKMCRTLAQEFSVTVTLAESPLAAVMNADLVVTATSAKEPLLTSDDLPPGAHVTAIGACRPGFREIEFRPNKSLKIFVDSHLACAVEADELIGLKVSGEIGQCFAGTLLGRENAEEITVFKSVGLGVEDIYAARFFARAASKVECGQEVAL